MSRKLAVILILLSIIFIVSFDIIMIINQSGKLERIIHSIQKFDSLYSQNFRMQQQLLLYSEKVNANAISRNDLKRELEKFIPASKIKTSGDTLSFGYDNKAKKGNEEIVEVDATQLLNMLLSYTNVEVESISLDSLIPVRYAGFSYSGIFEEKVVLTKLKVKVYGG